MEPCESAGMVAVCNEFLMFHAGEGLESLLCTKICHPYKFTSDFLECVAACPGLGLSFTISCQ